MPFVFRQLPIEGLVLVEPRIFIDERGSFLESYKESEFRANGIDERFVQDNHSRSARGVLRGLHFQPTPHEQGKLVRVIEGSVWDVAVDLRKGSRSYLKWFGLELSAQNNLSFYIPPGFAHGFVTISNTSQLQYKCTAEYDKASERGIRWDDPRIGIEWPIKNVLVPYWGA
jgi:dTDP-4-dehydrorhamnose 3,5-epimerase